MVLFVYDSRLEFTSAKRQVSSVIRLLIDSYWVGASKAAV